MAATDTLRTYRAKRDFAKTAEPSGAAARRRSGGYRYLIQKHDATRLHFDFRLELDGVLLSWAVTRGPSFDPKDKRLAVHTEDHPLDYGDFEGTIPKGEYGGGTVMLWDEGTWEPVGDPDQALAKGDLKFILHGERLKGKWVLVRMKPRKGERSKHENWLLIKERDEYAGEEKKPIIERVLTSVRSGRTMAEIAAGNIEWTRSGAQIRNPERSRSEKRAPRPASKPAKRSAGSAGDSALPKFVPPQLCTLVDAPPAGEGWVHEIKYDGYRMEAAVAGGKAAIWTRKGLDWSGKFPSLVRPLLDLPCRSALLDGEIAVSDKAGHTDFGALQDAIGDSGKGIDYYLFDLLFLDGEDLRKLPLTERKARLQALLDDQPRSGPLFYSDHVVGHGAEMFRRAADMKLEGIISKRADAPYRSERTKSWLKIKTEMGQEFIIIGWRPSDVAGRPFSSLLLGVREGERLIYAGRVGSGFGERELGELWPELKTRAAKSPAVEDVPRDIRRDAHFVRPELVAEIAFRGWTDDNVVRQAAYKGLRRDKQAAEIVAELPRETKAVARDAKRAPDARATAAVKKSVKPAELVTVDSDRDTGTIEVEGVRVTHPDRVLFPGLAITKRVLIDYYRAAADGLLPHVAKRPLSIVRCPHGAGGDCFFQKHASAGFPAEFKPIRIRDKSGSDQYFYIEDVRGLVAAVQVGVLELHIWGSHIDNLEQPDRIVFDFDPDDAVDFADVRAAAKDLRARLKDIGLVSFAMVTGGKGIHVVVPLTPHHDWDDVKGFAEAIARTVAAEDPERYLAEMSKARRKGKIFVDYLRNGRGATAIAPFSSRARKGAPVSWPVAWNALDRLESAHPLAIDTAVAALKGQKKDPWAGYFDVDQVLPLDRLRGRAAGR